MSKLRIMIIDDHELFRKGLIQLINQTIWGQVVADAGNISDGLVMMGDVLPDILLLDLYLGRNTRSFDYISKLKDISPNTKIVLLTVSEDEKDILGASEYQIDGYLLKSTPFSELELYLQEIWRGKVIISDSLGSSLFRELQQKHIAQNLSSREREVLQLIRQGKTNKDIAATLFISENTVKIHVSNILDKMCVRRRSEL